MISVQSAISRTRRDLTLAALIKIALLGAAVIAVLAGPVLGLRFDGAVALLVILVVGIMLSFRSVRSTQFNAEFPLLLASKQYDVAENRLEQSLRSFSIFKTVKLMNLHQLAMLRHAQNRWADAATLCQVLLRHRSAQRNGLGKSSQLMLASSLLALGDLRGTYDSLLRLYQQRLSLGEALRLLVLQLEYESRIGSWPHMLSGAGTKVQLCELMPPAESSRCYALLAEASDRVQRPQWAQWLRHRSELLGTSGADD
jgi:hypothetical protein